MTVDHHVDHDAVVVGDGPAGAAIAAACADAGLDVVVVGRGRPWSATYATWLDDVAELPRHVFGGVRDAVVVHTPEERRLARPYGVVDNAALRDHLRLADLLRIGEVATMRTATGADGRPGVGVVDLAGGGRLTARVVVDATGTGDAVRAPAWQTAYGVVVGADALGGRYPTDAVTLMDWRTAGRAGDPPSFCYVVPVADGWLVEETVLAAAPAVPPAALRPALVARLGAAAVAGAERADRVEQVRIPMGSPIRQGWGAVARFGAAAGMIHPATGYSVAAALRAAPRVAAAIRSGGDVHDAIWPRPAQRSRGLHDAGLSVLVRLGPDSVARFFGAFFGLPEEHWAEYLRVDADPSRVAAAMWQVFRTLPWSARRELARLDLRAVGRAIRP